jgi:hypothetical protein
MVFQGTKYSSGWLSFREQVRPLSGKPPMGQSLASLEKIRYEQN